MDLHRHIHNVAVSLRPKHSLRGGVGRITLLLLFQKRNINVESLTKRRTISRTDRCINVNDSSRFQQGSLALFSFID